MRYLALLALGTLLAGCGIPVKMRWGGKADVGYVGHLVSPKDGRVPVAGSEPAFERFVAAMVAHDHDAEASMARVGELYLDVAGTSVQNLGTVPGDGVHVRFLDGPHKGREGWVSILSLG